MWVTQTPTERKLYREVSDFVADSVRADIGGPGRPHYFTLMVLQKEMGSSWAAAHSTLEKLARHPDGLDPKRLRLLSGRVKDASASPSKLRTLMRALIGNVLEIDPQELLLAPDDTQLHSGLERRIACERDADAVFAQQSLQLLSRIVFTGHRQ